MRRCRKGADQSLHPIGSQASRVGWSQSTAWEPWAGTWGLSEASLTSWYVVKAARDTYAQGASRAVSGPGYLDCSVLWEVMPSCLYGLEELFITGMKRFFLFLFCPSQIPTPTPD